MLRADCTPMIPHTDRVDRTGWMDFLEVERRMPRVTQAEAIDLPCTCPHRVRELLLSLPEALGCTENHRIASRGTVFPALNSSIASSAILASSFWDLAKAWSQQLSSSSSMSILAAMASWLSGGSFETAARAFSSSSVMEPASCELRVRSGHTSDGRRSQRCIWQDPRPNKSLDSTPG